MTVFHVGETRGVGGIFFDDLEGDSHEKTFAFIRSCAESIIPAYLPIVEKRMNMAYKDLERCVIILTTPFEPLDKGFLYTVTMSRRHLESALVAGAFIESGLTPCFRFTRIRFVRYCFPPGYDGSTYDPDEAGAENQSSPTAAEGPAFIAHSTLATTCTCPDPQSEITPPRSNEDGIISAMVGNGDCEASTPVGTSSCKLHTEEYL
ncbi:hypothetical protein P879_10705, partial [Paragonimus westermani]